MTEENDPYRAIPLFLPTVSSGNENTFGFRLGGIAKGCNEAFLQIEPKEIICRHKPFPEMQGDIVFVNYEVSARKHRNGDPLNQRVLKNILIKFKKACTKILTFTTKASIIRAEREKDD